MDEDVNRNRKLFAKKVSNVKRGKVDRCSRIVDGNERFERGGDEVRRI